MTSTASVRQSVVSAPFNVMTLVNAGLLALGAVLLFYYVLSANGLAATGYHISSLRSDLAQATARQTALSTAADQSDDLASVNAFAVAHNMVVAKDSSYIFENGNVALVR